jgi:hypothetical protein
MRIANASSAHGAAVDFVCHPSRLLSSDNQPDATRMRREYVLEGAGVWYFSFFFFGLLWFTLFTFLFLLFISSRY